MKHLGKKKCEVLRQVRKKIADANGIDYTPHECNHEGDCAGTCPACEQEVRYIEGQLQRMRKAGRAAVVVGAALGISALGSSCNRMLGPHQVVGLVPYHVDSIDVPPPEIETELEGDVVAEVDTVQSDTAAVDTIELCLQQQSAHPDSTQPE